MKTKQQLEREAAQFGFSYEQYREILSDTLERRRQRYVSLVTWILQEVEPRERPGHLWKVIAMWRTDDPAGAWHFERLLYRGLAGGAAQGVLRAIENGDLREAREWVELSAYWIDRYVQLGRIRRAIETEVLAKRYGFDVRLMDRILDIRDGRPSAGSREEHQPVAVVAAGREE